jgi:hypothetical protein
MTYTVLPMHIFKCDLLQAVHHHCLLVVVVVVSPLEVLCLLEVPEGMKVLTQSQHHWTGLEVGSVGVPI